MKHGYSDKALFVNLSGPKIEVRDLNKEIGPDWRQKWIGGRGLNIYFLTTGVNSYNHALSPENILAISPGPMNGSSWPSAGKTVISAKSPATHGYGESSLGGTFGPHLRWADFDGIFATGRASEPSILVIDAVEGKNYIRSSIESKDSLDLGKKLVDEYGKKNSAALTIGPAGKNMVQYACVHGIHHIKPGGRDIYVPRNAGRTGMGAVMGSKNLEAIVIRSERIDYNPADSEKFREFGNKLRNFVGKHPDFRHTLNAYGTPFLVPIVQELKIFPTKNFEHAQFGGFKGLGPKAIEDNIGAKAYGCFGCNILCGKFSKIDDKDVDLEYETIALLGSNLMIDDINYVARAGLLCDELGLDTISAGNAIGFAMEAMEKGFLNDGFAEELDIPAKDLDLLEWGNGEKVLKLLRKISDREGIGALLALGVRGMKTLMPGTENFAMEQRGVEYSGYVTTEAPHMALAYAMSDFGAHHRKAWVITAERAGECNMEILKFFESLRTWVDMAGVCKLPWIDYPHPDSKDRKNLVVAEWYRRGFGAMTGIEYPSMDEMLVVPEGIYNTIRSWNLAQGQTQADEMVPKRVLNHSYPGISTRKAAKKFRHLRKDYYGSMGWTRKGVPTKETLRKFGIEELVENFE